VKAARPAAVAAAALLLLPPAATAGDDDGWRFDRGLRLRNSAARFQLGITGYGQFDFLSFLNWENRDPDRPLEDGEADVRRARLGLEGEWRRLSFEAEADLEDEDEHLSDAWVGLRLSRAFRLRVGNMKVPVSREWLTSARRIDFAERALMVESLAPGRDWGAVLHGRAGAFEYEVGAFRGDGRTRRSRSETTGAGRIGLHLGKDVEVGGSFSAGDVVARPGGLDEALDPRGVAGQALSGHEFFREKYVDGRRLRYGADAVAVMGPAALKAEYLELRESRRGQGAAFDDLPDVVGRGWSASATWLVTGEKKKGTIEPARSVPRGLGAVELGLRYEELRFDDAGDGIGLAGVGDRSRNLRPSGDRAFTGGLSWWPAAPVRLIGNVAVERFTDPLLAPEPAEGSKNYVSLRVRLQVELP
jgi:phosphate-selective porin